MNSRTIYTGAVILLLFLVILCSRYTGQNRDRKQQHLESDMQVEDTNLSIRADTFSSRLPVVNIRTDGQVIPGRLREGQNVGEIEDVMILADFQLMDRQGTLHTLQDKPDVEQAVKIRVRGNSSRLFDKPSYLFQFVDENGEEAGQEVMGMEKNSTWVMHGPFLDKSLMRNYMWYNLSGQIMNWAPDVRYCEVFLDGIYQGIYVMTEQISVGEGRVEISKYEKGIDVTSYIICVDRPSVNDNVYLNNFTKYSRRLRGQMEIKYPGPKKITPQLADFISKDFSRFEKTLYSYDYDSKRYGYRDYIDTDSFVDYFIINEVTENTDAGLFSTYFYKDVSGKLNLCVWDFNNCSNNYMEKETEMDTFFMQNRTWFFMLMKDEAFVERIIERYKELRQGILSNEALSAYIGETGAYLGSAVERNYKVWGYSFQPENDLLKGQGREITSYDEAVEQYESRLLQRVNWMDENIEVLRSYSHESVNKKFNH